MPASANSSPVTPIAIAVVRHEGSVLIGQRPPNVPLAGLWEFPGGKIEPTETPEHAAKRECLEEAGIAVEVLAQFPTVYHDYEHARVELSFFDCRPKESDPAPKSPYLWVALNDLSRYQFPEANASVLHLLLDQVKRRTSFKTAG
jgi:mutator protein MutT